MELQKQSHLSDEEIVALYFARDERALRETDSKYGKFLFAMANNILGDRGDSEECLDDAYIRVWNSIPPASPRALLAFLYTVVRRKAIDRYRTERKKRRVPSELTVSLTELEGFLADGAASETQVDGLGQLLSAYVGSLSERRMYIFMSRYYAARSIGEIAGRLGCSASTVNKEIAAIKRELKKRLESEGYTV